MSRTPEVIINQPLKTLHHTLAGVGGFFLLIAALHFAMGNNGILQIIIGAALFYLASKIKYRLVKQVEVSGYKRM